VPFQRASITYLISPVLRDVKATLGFTNEGPLILFSLYCTFEFSESAASLDGLGTKHCTPLNMAFILYSPIISSPTAKFTNFITIKEASVLVPLVLLLFQGLLELPHKLLLHSIKGLCP
jgi:hypothetical protein